MRAWTGAILMRYGASGRCSGRNGPRVALSDK